MNDKDETKIVPMYDIHENYESYGRHGSYDNKINNLVD